MNPQYFIADTSALYSPGLVFYRDLIHHNIAHAITIAGSPDRLRPHVKTHKTREIVRMQMEAGIRKHKCATLAEAEMLAQCGVPDIFLAYNMVGPNCARLAKLIKAFPESEFAVTADHPAQVEALAAAMAEAKQKISVFLDIDVGQHRTGVVPGEEAARLYEMIAATPGIEPGGLQIYDGHNHQESPVEREQAVQKLLEPVLAFRKSLLKKGLAVPRLIAGGTPTFPIFAKLDLPGMELSPGTCVLHDHGYGSRFKDLAGFIPAALMFTRVVSRPTATRVTMDLGTKAMASDPPAGKRCILLNVPEYEPILQNEEHFVIETATASCLQPGDEIYAMPTHICPTCALHRQANVVENGRLTEKWDIIARDRLLTF